MAKNDAPRYRSFADAADKPQWTPVINPAPFYNGVEEKRRYEDAFARNPRAEGEDVCDWLARVAAAARPSFDRELPPGDRDPGEEG